MKLDEEKKALKEFAKCIQKGKAKEALATLSTAVKTKHKNRLEKI